MGVIENQTKPNNTVTPGGLPAGQLTLGEATYPSMPCHQEGHGIMDRRVCMWMWMPASQTRAARASNRPCGVDASGTNRTPRSISL